MGKIILIIVAVTIGGLFLLTQIDNSRNTVNGGDNITTSTNDPNSTKVSITGEVNRPGDYNIAVTRTLGDLIDLAGGTTLNADPDSYVSTVTIGNRKSFFIPSKSKIPDSCVAEMIEKVNINKATESELNAIGFKSNQAKALVAYREKNGDFECIEDIVNVSGIGVETYTKLRELLTLR